MGVVRIGRENNRAESSNSDTSSSVVKEDDNKEEAGQLALLTLLDLRSSRCPEDRLIASLLSSSLLVALDDDNLFEAQQRRVITNILNTLSLATRHSRATTACGAVAHS